MKTLMISLMCSGSLSAACIIPDFPLDFRFDFIQATGAHFDQGGVEIMSAHDQDDFDFFTDPLVTIFDESVFQGEWRTMAFDTFKINGGNFHSTLVSGEPFDWHAELIPGSHQWIGILARISRIDDYDCANGAHWIRLPEPSSMLLAMIAALNLILRTRRNGSAVNNDSDYK